MGTEIEAKMRIDDPAALAAALRRAGGKRAASLFEVNTYFDTSTGSMKASDQGLRIRVERDLGRSNETVIVTHKGPRARGRVKRRPETELTVCDARAAAALLEALGHVPVLSFEKRRDRWKLGGCHVDVDRLPLLGDFVEIEGPSTKAVLAVRKRLGLGASPLITDSYVGMLTAYLRKRGIRTRNLRLSS